MSIVFFDTEDWEKEVIPKHIGGVPVIVEERKLGTDTINIALEAKVISIFAWSTISKELLDQLPNVKCIATRSTGVDHIDLKACAERDIVVCNVPGYGERTVAEHTFALMLALSRKILPGGDRTRGGSFSREGLRGFDLEGKTLGIVGCGQIGRRVAEIAQAFAMDIIIYDIEQDEEFAQKIGGRYAKTLKELLEKSDVVSLHAPLTENTKHMINMETIEHMKSGALLINTARGDLIQTAALLKALDENKIAGAGLDVIEHESLVGEDVEILSNDNQSNLKLSALLRNHILLSNPKVIITPHNAFNSEEALSKLLNTTVKNIESFLSDKKQNVIS
jgi:D-lactate dehydrogenase